MTTEKLSKETEQMLIDFFNTIISAKDLAKTIRRLNYIVALGILRKDETLKLELEKISDGFYWLNEFAEILDPYFEVE
ncbi:hypothetical protein BC749_101892 [Flavobacterium araucananum]|uniref:Uncharacterized protein n=1 Tax=Flavobacterium araucananum TaxID=946678 RepID=A0A227PHS7_9FLAO|nr:hypothetical protein [Flavobacterium araucananum]OXG09429.1 hypothetical protein B0A64_01340 [Flavobacterium araucananum]PWK02814.1 hypothetical protein BC749_101892 [Flavobacterium araucananum]